MFDNIFSNAFIDGSNGIVLAKYYLLAPDSVDAYYCGNCKKIVIDVDEENET